MGSRAFEEGELGGAAMAGAFRGGGGEGTDREAEPRRRRRRCGGGFEDEAVGFFNYSCQGKEELITVIETAWG